MKILINTPSLKLVGGVSNHYLGLIQFWTENVKYNTVGKSKSKSKAGRYLLLLDILKFIFRLLTFRPDIVLLNPSLGQTALRRDFFYQNVARFFGFKTALFVHGFNWDYAHSLDQEYVAKEFNKASVIFILAKAFGKEMRDWGVTVPISLSTTKVDDKLLEGYNPAARTGRVNNILFLSRVEKAKGIYITIDTFRILKKKYPHLHLTIAGDGDELPKVKKYIADNGVCDVDILGRISGDDLVQAYKNADLFSFFSYHGEGMPTAVLEAMAFGLPIFTRNVGGLPDFFVNGKMGYITESFDSRDFANAMIPYIEGEDLYRKVSAYNAKYAHEHFMASSVAKNIEKILREHI